MTATKSKTNQNAIEEITTGNGEFLIARTESLIFDTSIEYRFHESEVHKIVHLPINVILT